MAKTKGTRVVILVEDRALERFARNALLQLGFHRRELRVSSHPVGQGSAKQWVETQYPQEVRAYRSKANSQQIALLVGTDADEQTVNQRARKLEKVLQEATVDARGEQERIVLWIPKRNIEAWILHLSGEDVDEDDKDCKKRVSKLNFKYEQVAAAFVRQFREVQAVEMLASLKTAYRETRRLDL